MQQIRHRRPRARREPAGQDVLPPGSPDPDVTRAKALARKRHPSAKGKSTPRREPPGQETS